MVTGFTNASKSGYPNCYIDASSDTSGALVCSGVGTFGDTSGFPVAGVSSVSATAPNWYGQPDVVVAAYAGRFYYSPQPSQSAPATSTWSVDCSPSSIWVNSGYYNYTYYDSYGYDWHLNYDWMAIATSVSPGTDISCSATLTIALASGGSLTYHPPGSFSIEFFGA